MDPGDPVALIWILIGVCHVAIGLTWLALIAVLVDRAERTSCADRASGARWPGSPAGTSSPSGCGSPPTRAEAAIVDLPIPASPDRTRHLRIRILGVSEVARAIKAAVREDPRLGDLWVEGEIGRVTVSTAGHAYFALKDERSQLQCVWFRDDRLRSVFEARSGHPRRRPRPGRPVRATGRAQLYVESLQPAGVGDLALRFESSRLASPPKGCSRRLASGRCPRAHESSP